MPLDMESMSGDQWLDVLSARRHSSDLWWTTSHDWKCSQYKYTKNRTPEQIREDVFNDPLIESQMKQNPRLKTRIDDILTEMSHDFSLRTVRFVGYFLTKIMKTIYGSVYVNNHLVLGNTSSYFNNSWTSSLSQTLNGLAKECPILYVPSHRSYADFLLFSFICFSLDLPMPSIAAGIDFLALNQIASLLRSCGAFYIRRSFKHSSDNIYWCVFRAYLQSQLRGSERPLEFFIEGTRSRNGKSLYPRTGLLSAALELYFTGQIPDLLIIPVSISYDRVLEEGLYAKELMPSDNFKGKPAETPRHLFSGAKAILSQNFGSIYIRFCEPISVRQLDSSQEIRRSHSMDSKCNPNVIQSQQELDFVLDLSKSIIRSQQMDFVFSSFTFTSLILLTHFDCNLRNNVFIPIALLLEDIQSLSSLLNERNLSFGFGLKCLETEFMESLDIHSNIVGLSEDKRSVIVDTSDPLVGNQLQHYANQSMQLLIDSAIYLYSCGHYLKYERIKWFLSQEFIYKSSEALDSYLLAQFVTRRPLSERTENVLVFQIDYYLKNYLLLTKWLLKYESSHQNSIDLKLLVKTIQKDMILSSNLIQNFITILVRSNAMSKDFDNKLSINSCQMNDMTIELSQLSSRSQSQQSIKSYSNFKLKANL